MDQVLFCPFCRESFEDQSHCPEHELELVPLLALPKRRREFGDDEPLSLLSPALGRGALALGAVATLLAFVALPLARVDGPVAMGGTMLRLALSSTPKLWLVPAAASACLSTLHRRRTPRGMRGARLALLVLSVIPPAVVVWTYRGVVEAVALLSVTTLQPLTPSLALGAFAVIGAALPACYGALRLGVVRRSASST
ncbi:MAG: hypothetical protein OEZ06_04590 [Myxococcales bacterium]|nr:hypothetical protein [Myxococcales bacterium]